MRRRGGRWRIGDGVGFAVKWIYTWELVMAVIGLAFCVLWLVLALSGVWWAWIPFIVLLVSAVSGDN